MNTLDSVRLMCSDYQTGDWDTDAAETIAYHGAYKYAYVASAESGVVKVVDLSNPTAMSEVATLSVGADLNTSCLEVDCVYERMDFGGRHNPCGYGTIVRMVVDYGTLDVDAGVAYGSSGNFSMPSCESPHALGSQHAARTQREASDARLCSAHQSCTTAAAPSRGARTRR